MIKYAVALMNVLLVLAVTLPGATSQAGKPASGDPVRALAAQARELIQHGKITDALALLSELKKRGESDPEAEFAAGEILQELAALRVEQLQRVAPDSAETHELLGKSLEAQGKLEQALTEYRLASERAPGKPGLHFLVGNVEWKLRQFGGAQHDLGEELKLNPHHAMANLRMGQILLDTQRDAPAQALANLQEAVAGAPESLEAHRELGKAFRLAHSFPQALKEFQFVEVHAPNDSSIHAQLAALYKDMGETAKAREEIAAHAKILRERLEASQRVHTQ